MTPGRHTCAMPASAAQAAGWDCHVHVFDAAAPVRPGHYQPVDRPLQAIERLAAAHDVHHLVLVQPSVYGSDNRVLLRALAAEPGRHIGIAVVDASQDARHLERTLDHLHAAGVRGVRFNLVSPAGHAGGVAGAQADLHQLAPHLRERGWHAQWYVPAGLLPQLVGWQARSSLPFVLDHLAGLTLDLPDADPAWQAAAALAADGAWIKLSGWYRLGATLPYTALHGAIRRAAALFGPRTVWGSDWPHTSFAPDQLPPYDSTLAPLREALGQTDWPTILGRHARALYKESPPQP